MYCVAINIGSSTIKIGLYECINQRIDEKEKKVLENVPAHVIDAIKQFQQTYQITESDIHFGMRMVHGGNALRLPTRVTAETLDYLDSISSLAPLHNPPAVHFVRLLQQHFPQSLCTVVFDTMFHSTLPDKASRYALPDEITKTLPIRRYGFHGLAYSSIVGLYAQQMNIPKEKVTLIALQLGSGCSIAAIKDGISVDTSMGFSPLEGLVSRTRTGDLDPSIVSYMKHTLGKEYDEIFHMLNHESGLAGMSHTDGHVSTLFEKNTDSAKKAIDVFVYRIQKYIGSYDVVLGGQFPIVFAGGIAEHSAQMLELICHAPYLGIQLDLTKNSSMTMPLTRISTDISSRHAYVAFVDEEYEIARLISH